MRFITIKTRVTIYFTLMMVLVVALVLVFMLIVGQRVLTNNAEATLLDVVHDNIDDVEYKDGYLDLDELNLYRHNVYILVYDDAQQLIGGAGLRHFDGDDEFFNGETRDVVIDGENYLVYDLYVQNPGGNVWLRGITSTDNSFSAVRIIVILSLVLFPVLVLLTAVVGWLIARRAFLPVRQITDTVDAISDGSDLTARIGLKRGRDEIHRLAATFDRMFDRLEHSFDAEKRFASDASHELRTPITVILAECDRAKRKAYTRGDFLESVGVIEQQSEHMSQLVQALLGLTRMEHGTDKYPIKRMDLSALVCSCCEECPPPPGSHAEVELDIQPDIQAACNAGLMSRVVVNLLQNAYKYGGEQVRVRVSLHENADGKAVLRVADDGPGIAPEDQDKVWQRFWQADPSRGEDGGSGLGLAMVKEIVQLHGGSVGLESTPGKGSIFSVTL